MNNEEKILTVLEQMQTNIGQMQADIKGLEQGQTEMRAEMNERFDAVNERFDNLEFSLNEAWTDIGKMADRLEIHETAYPLPKSK